MTNSSLPNTNYKITSQDKYWGMRKMNNVKTYFKEFEKAIFDLDTSLYWLYLVYFISGIVFSEILFISSIVGKRISDWSIGEAYSDFSVLTISVVAFVCMVFYILSRGMWKGFIRFIKSSHPEVLIVFLMGAGFTFYKGGFNVVDYEKDLITLDGETLLILCSIPFVLVFLLVINTFFTKITKKAKRITPIFLSDDAISNEVDDYLELAIKAEKFAISVLNNGSSDSLVFGVDSPWGTGKSSFINLCVKYWDGLNDSSPVVFRFEPVRYLEQTNLADVFANELIKEIQKVSFDPYLSSTFENYLRLLNNAKKISIFGFEFNFFRDENLISAFDKLQKCLIKFDRKIIVIIDDLDRLSWRESKKILYSIKQSFKLKNLSYVLCYDTENLSGNSNSSDALDIQVFLEKYINIKFSLFNDKALLAKLVSEDSDKLVKKIISQDVLSVSYIKQTLAMLQDFYSSKDYEIYAYFLGDLRKVKRLINTIVLIDVHSNDFLNIDIDSQDLINLLILYLSYPSLFRKIYNSETYGGKEVFSIRSVAGKYENSDKFNQILKDPTCSKGELFLLRKLFCVETLKANSTTSKERLNASTRACFNSSNFSNRNLENYLNLIVNLAKPLATESTAYYINNKTEFINGKTLTKVFESINLSGPELHHAHIEILNVIGNSASELSNEQANEVIWFILQNIHKYSFVRSDIQSLSQRNSLIYVLLAILDISVLNSELTMDMLSEVRSNEINDWIFGEGKHQNLGITSVLVNEQRLPLGYYDLLLFRLYCSADRNNSFKNISKALSSKGDSLESDSNSLVGGISGMRLITQTIFGNFFSQYIKPKKNIFEDIKALTSYQLAPAGEAFSLEDLERTKIGLLSFILYQLTNKNINMGVGCGYFDPTNFKEDFVTLSSPAATIKGLKIVTDEKETKKRTVDGNEIYNLMNDYIFEVCFNPDLNPSNIENFIYYLLINLTNPIDIGGGPPRPTNLEFNKVLDLRKLKMFWNKNKDTILRNQFHLRTKQILHPNYTVTYEKDLLGIYTYLDELDPIKAVTN